MLNRVTLLGRLGRDPETQYSAGGNARCTLSVATSRSWIDRERSERRTETTWSRVVAWGKQAELCAKFLHKGSLVCVDGRLNSRSYEKDGQKRVIVEVVAEDVKFLDKYIDASGSSQEYPATPAADIPDPGDDIPF